MVGDVLLDTTESGQMEVGSVRNTERSVNFEVDGEVNGHNDDDHADSNNNSNRRLSSAVSMQSRRSLLQSNTAALMARERSWEEALNHCVADAGLNAFGCVFVEVWAMSDGGTHLFRPSGGHWMDPAFAQSLPSEEQVEKAWELEREAGDCPPGAGL